MVISSVQRRWGRRCRVLERRTVLDAFTGEERTVHGPGVAAEFPVAVTKDGAGRLPADGGIDRVVWNCVADPEHLGAVSGGVRVELAGRLWDVWGVPRVIGVGPHKALHFTIGGAT